MKKHQPPFQQPVILGLECSGDSASASIFASAHIMAFCSHQAKYGHAETLVGLAEQALRQAGCHFSDLTHIAAGCGPGSFTGIRVCLSAAKGYRLATGARAVGVNGLAALCLDRYLAPDSPKPGHYLACTDSRRGSYFTLYADHTGLAGAEISDIAVRDMPAYLAALLARTCRGPLLVAGPPALCAALSDMRGETLVTAACQPDARMIASYAACSLGDRRCETGPLEPLYIVPPKLGPQRAARNPEKL